MQQYGIKWIGMSDDDYPKRLSSISKPPSVLYYRGDISIVNQGRNIAVVGSRRVSERGVEYAFRIGYELGRRGITVVNGLALGCDTYALQGALAAGGACVAVMPCGLDQIVPRSNSSLARKLLSCGGCLLSAYPNRIPVRRYQYVERDCLQSGISDGVLVIEAESDSGTMHTVKYSIKQGRKLACVDSSLLRYASGNRWIEGQRGVFAVQNTADVEVFIDALCNEAVYTQVTLETFAKE